MKVNGLFYRAKCVSSFFEASFTLWICFFVTVDMPDFCKTMSEDICFFKSTIILRLLVWAGVSFTFFSPSGSSSEMKMEIKVERGNKGLSKSPSNEHLTLQF